MSIYQRGVEFFDSFRAQADPRTKDLFLVYNTPVYVWVCSVSYLLFVWLGPKFMKNRHPFELRWFMIFYNAFLVLLSSYMVAEILYSAYLNNYNFLCQPYDPKVTPLIPSEARMAKVLWWYFFSKLIEFMDTVLMVLRKKNDQISFLHVFHHVSMLNIWWFCIMGVPGGVSWFATSLNSLVHVFMYSYYLLNLFPTLRKHLWWKKYITQMQLTQFVLILFHTCYVYMTPCDFPHWAALMLIYYMFIMLTLFGNFYLQAYVRGRRVKPIEKHGDSGYVSNGLGKHSDQNGYVKVD